MPELNEVLTEQSVQSVVETVATAQTRTKAPADKKVKLVRPPIEQITEDICDYITSFQIAGNKVVKLGFSCGKILYGFKDENGDEFRVIALKARKKTLSVEKKSRAMFFFGISNAKQLLKLYSDLPVSTSERGACSCQVKEPLFLTLDKTTFTENFKSDVNLVLSTLRNLVVFTMDQKTEEWELKTETAAAQKAKAV